jgi:putative transcriptional regulator
VPVFAQRRLGKEYAEALQNPQSWLEIFVLECENRLSQTPISGIIKQSNSLTGGTHMAISYNKLWKLLIDRKMSKADLRRAAGIAPNTMTKLNRDEEVTLETLGKICGVLKVNVGDIVDIFPDAP